MARRKDNVDLICSIAELSGLFEKSRSLEDFLQTVVSVVAWHMKAAVCSVYLYNEEDRCLVLSATQGLNPEAVGRVKLKLGEGITGKSLKELRPVYVGQGSRHPDYKPFPGIEEEQYEAFLAVPILRGLERIGALVVQDPQPNYFDKNDAKALRAIAAQLASTIESAQLLISLEGLKSAKKRKEADAFSGMIRSTPASNGLALGSAVAIDHPFEEILTHYDGSTCVLDAESFRQALLLTGEQLEDLQRQMEETHSDIASLIFSAHLLILRDNGFSGRMLEQIQEGKPVAHAVVDVVNNYVNLFSRSDSDRLKEKVHDVKDLGHRLLQNLFREEVAAADYTGQIVISDVVFPSDIVKLAAQNVEGILMLGGGVVSHVAILARSLQIPMAMVADREKLSQIEDGTPLLMDTNSGCIYVKPDETILENYTPLLNARESDEWLNNRPDRVLTADGTRIRVMANINLLSDVEKTLAYKADGVGLYRSEFPFIVRTDFPSEEEQYRIYRNLIKRMDGHEVVLRTLDAGGDKMLSYFPSVEEDNPFLGLRAIRFSLRHKEIFMQQLRAMLRAGAGTELKIMFPLVASVDDFIQAKSVVQECVEQLKTEDLEYCCTPRLGVMIELPSAVLIAEELAMEVDFLCIGSNDLTQYTLAVDRTNDEVAHIYREHHPSVLRAIKLVVDAGKKFNREVSLCGEMAGDRKLLPFLIGCGIHRLSINPSQIPVVQDALIRLDLTKARTQAEQLIREGRINRIETMLATWDAEWFGVEGGAEPSAQA